jgi:hypothetical protein
MRKLICSTLILATTVFSTVAQARWLEASTRHFVIYSRQPPKQLRTFAERLERFDQALRLASGVPDPAISPANRLTVVLFGSRKSVQELYARTSFTVQGFYDSTAGNTLAVAITERERGHDVLFHEYAHHWRSRP